MSLSACVRGLMAAIIPYMGSLGHCGRALVAAKQLRNDGWHVVALGEGPFSRLFAEEGIPLIRCRSVPYEDLGKWMAHYLGGLPFPPLSDKGAWNRPDACYSLESCAQSLLCTLKDVKPASAISDGVPWARIACQAAGIPHIALTSWTWTGDFVARMRPPLQNGLDRETALDNYIRTPEHLLAPYNNAAAQFGAQPISASWQALGGDVCALADATEILPDALPPDLTSTGPLCWDGETPAASEWTAPRSPYVVASTGTSRSSLIDSFLTRFEARTPFAIVKIGDLRSSSRAIAPAYRLLCGSAGFICHGGSQSLHQAFFAGVPTLVIPTHFEQLWNGWLFARQKHFALWPDNALAQEESWKQFSQAIAVTSRTELKPRPLVPLGSRLSGICERILAKGGIGGRG